MRRREFIAGLGSVAWPLGAFAQQPAEMRRIGILMGLAETDPFTVKYGQELRDALQSSGWTDSQNIQLVYRYAAGDPELARKFAKELVEMQPDLIVGHTTPVAAALSQVTRTLPVVFMSITDPVVEVLLRAWRGPAAI
jgi:putative ABC transport system substrate-binding protein